MHNKSSAKNYQILIVDDEPLVRDSLSELLALSGYIVNTADNGHQALKMLHQASADVIITDVKMPEMDGMQLLKEIKSSYPGIPVIIVTGHASIESAVAAMKEGAYDYITKPIVDSEMQIVIERVIRQHNIEEENRHLKEQLSASPQRERFYNIAGKSPGMQKIYNLIEAIAHTQSTVLVSGESGTGKRLIAQAIHKHSEKDNAKPFIEVSCGALTETLLESELFGHIKGAFTGAIKDKAGRFELAHGGTIFLDEIDAFSPALQVKLLRVLQEGEFERVGDTKTIKIDVRVITATNQNLHDLIAQGKFRKDLFYRLNIIVIDLPPLRERKEDIPLLINEFMQIHSTRAHKKIEGVSPQALSLLIHYNWPGNIRELENVIERATILSKGTIITPDDFPEFLHTPREDKKETHGDGSLKLKDALQSPEKDHILRTLDLTNWNRNETASMLGINRTTLYKKMQKFGLLKRPRRHA